MFSRLYSPSQGSLPTETGLKFYSGAFASLASAVVGRDFAKFADFAIQFTFMGRVAPVKNRMERARISNRFTEQGVSERQDVRGSTQSFQDVWGPEMIFSCQS